jgi:hypothetical protein
MIEPTLLEWLLGICLGLLIFVLLQPEGRQAFMKILHELRRMCHRVYWQSYSRQIVNKIRRKRRGVDPIYQKRAGNEREVIELDRFSAENDDQVIALALAYAETVDHPVTLLITRELWLTRPITIPVGLTHFHLDGQGRTLHFDPSVDRWWID